MHATYAQFAIPALIILWVVYRRIRRTVGSQPFEPRRLRVRIGIFAVVGLLLLELGLQHPMIWAGDAAGTAAGCILAAFAIRHTQFERREAGLYYRTHTGIQLAVVALLLIRVVVRFANMGTYAPSPTADPGNQVPMQAFAGDPWTSGIFFVLVAFYVAYYLYILRQGKERLAHENGGPNQTEAP
ncbi:CcdC protein domain-containing protein [Cohnella caldifontis]|uniref:CcdC protein domain-containing protein n=1 Tax=Cohnella caldifontis TaxID=3027471 RepID=UPI0023EB4831|nr:CcdC protein domain-containing protein [Cohnella sp. YIM B05605]